MKIWENVAKFCNGCIEELVGGTKETKAEKVQVIVDKSIELEITDTYEVLPKPDVPEQQFRTIYTLLEYPDVHGYQVRHTVTFDWDSSFDNMLESTPKGKRKYHHVTSWRVMTFEEYVAREKRNAVDILDVKSIVTDTGVVRVDLIKEVLFDFECRDASEDHL